MKDFFSGKSFKILLTCVVILIAFLIYTQSVNRSFIADVINFISAPMQSVSSGATAKAHSALEDAADTEDSLRAEIARLEEENRQYREQLVDYADCKNKVKNYETVLEIKEKNRDFMMVAGAVIGRDPSDLFYGFSIDVGSADGVYEGAPVITGDGLIGWISKTYTSTSIVTTIFSADTQIGAMSAARDEKGVLQSDLVLADQKQVRLAFLDTDTAIVPGDLITTTGLGGQFPKGLMIGAVISVERSEYDVSKYAVIEPFADMENIRNVFVLVDFTGKDEITETAESAAPTEEPSSASSGEESAASSSEAAP